MRTLPGAGGEGFAPGCGVTRGTAAGGTSRAGERNGAFPTDIEFLDPATGVFGEQARIGVNLTFRANGRSQVQPGGN